MRALTSEKERKIRIVTIFLGLSVGAKLVADKFLQPQTLGILLLGVIAWCSCAR
uniref:sodium ion-translocating decarboxylase subunit beta n=1 Tax=Salmonella enterica TaxID=28901 RepID=UPI000EFC4D44